MQQEIINDIPWWEQIMNAFQNLWGDQGLIAFCVLVVVILFMFRKSISGVISKITGK